MQLLVYFRMSDVCGIEWNIRCLFNDLVLYSSGIFSSCITLGSFSTFLFPTVPFAYNQNLSILILYIYVWVLLIFRVGQTAGQKARLTISFRLTLL